MEEREETGEEEEEEEETAAICDDDLKEKEKERERPFCDGTFLLFIPTKKDDFHTHLYVTQKHTQKKGGFYYLLFSTSQSITYR